MKKIFLILTGIIFITLGLGIVLAARMPVVNGDPNTWGTVLNTYLNISHNDSGQLRNNTVASLQIINETIVDDDISDITNLTLGEKITFTLGGIIDNIVNGWITMTGGLNVIGHTNLSGNLYAGNSSLFVNASSGFVGIGTNNPSQKLDVRGQGNFSGVIWVNNGTQINGSTYNATYNNYANNVSLNYSKLTYDNWNTAWLSTYNATYVAINTTANIQGLLNGTSMNFANVGIGTASPDMKLDVIGHTNLSGNLYAGNSTLFVNASSGNVGIGTTSPLHNLQIE